MPRKEKLPPGVSSFVDRHGKRRYRWRSKGQQRYFHAHPNTVAGKAEQASFVSGQENRPSRHAHGTIGWLAERFLASPTFLGNKGEGFERTARQTLDKFVAEHAAERVVDLRFNHVEAILLKTSKPWLDAKGRKRGGPHAAARLRDQLAPLFRYAQRLELIKVNPVELATTPAAPSKGFHTWTEDEIAQFRKRHALGTSPRLALEIFLWTAQRKGDGAKFGPKHLKGGKIHFVAGKTGGSLWLPAAPQLLAAIEAMPVVGTETFLLTSHGKPFSVAGLGNKMREWCDQAGLPHCSAHGLRKALARRAAEQGASNQRLKAIGGWKRDEEVALYTAAVEQAAMAEAALAPVIAMDRG